MLTLSSSTSQKKKCTLESNDCSGSQSAAPVPDLYPSHCTQNTFLLPLCTSTYLAQACSLCLEYHFQNSPVVKNPTHSLKTELKYYLCESWILYLSQLPPLCFHKILNYYCFSHCIIFIYLESCVSNMNVRSLRTKTYNLIFMFSSLLQNAYKKVRTVLFMRFTFSYFNKL